LKLEQLKLEYLADEKYLYSNKHFELAELYYKLLRLLDPFYKSLRKEYVHRDIEKYADDFEDQDENYNYDDSNFHIKKTYASEESNDDLNDKNNKSEIELIDDKKIKKIFYKFLIFLGREIEVKFEDNNDDFKFSKIFFFKSPKCFWLNETYKNKLLSEAPRESLGEKLNYFNKNLDLTLLEINICYKMKPSFSLIITKKIIPFVLNNLDLHNFILILLLNIYLLLYTFIDTSPTLATDLNSQIFDFTKSEKIQQKHPYIFILTIIVIFIQIMLLTVWYYIFYSIKLMKSSFKNIFDGKYLLNDYSDEKEFNFKSFTAYDEMYKKFNNLEHENLTLKSQDKTTWFKSLFIKLKIILWNKEIKYVVFSLLCLLLFLITKEYILLVLPIFSIVRLYSLFDYFLQAILSKFKEFGALLIFIYVIEYIFSWMSFLHFQEFLPNEYKLRTGDLNEVNIIYFIYLIFCFIEFQTLFIIY